MLLALLWALYADHQGSQTTTTSLPTTERLVLKLHNEDHACKGELASPLLHVVVRVITHSTTMHPGPSQVNVVHLAAAAVMAIIDIADLNPHRIELRAAVTRIMRTSGVPLRTRMILAMLSRKLLKHTPGERKMLWKASVQELLEAVLTGVPLQPESQELLYVEQSIFFVAEVCLTKTGRVAVSLSTR